MAGSAVLGTNLVDDLVPLVDELRQELNVDFGVRAWRVYTVERTWSGSRRGEGTPTDVEHELIPRPRITTPQGRALDPAGMHEHGTIILREVSLTYTESELMGAAKGDIVTTKDWLFAVREANGQAQSTRYYEMEGVPFLDREDEIGWRITLNRADGADGD